MIGAAVLALLPLAAAQAAEPSRPERGIACDVRFMDGGLSVFAYRLQPDCTGYGPAEVLEGVWVDSFEGQRFVPGARTAEDVRKDQHPIWADLDDRTVLPSNYVRALYTYRLFRVRLVGRMSTEVRPGLFGRARGGYGHMSLSEAAVLVERFDHVEPLPND